MLKKIAAGAALAGALAFTAAAPAVLSAASLTDVDTTAADMLATLDEEINADNISLVFAELKDPVREKLEKYELIGHYFDPAHFFPTLDTAISAYREQTGAKWEPPRDGKRTPT